MNSPFFHLSYTNLSSLGPIQVRKLWRKCTSSVPFAYSSTERGLTPYERYCLACAIVEKTSKKFLTGSMLACASLKPLATICTTNQNNAHLLSIETTKRRGHVTLGEREINLGVEVPGKFLGPRHFPMSYLPLATRKL